MFTQPLVNTYAVAGYNATLNCSVRGNPKVPFFFFNHTKLNLRINSKLHLLYLLCYNCKYWVGQKVYSGFSMTSYGKTQTNALANPTVILADFPTAQCVCIFWDREMGHAG